MTEVTLPKMILCVERYEGQVETVSLKDWIELDIETSLEEAYEKVEGNDDYYGSSRVVTYTGEEDMFIVIY